nr:uncharacterized protein LOC111420297 [Onthophagus taurus]
MGFMNKLCRKCKRIRYTTAKNILIIFLSICVMFQYNMRLYINRHIHYFISKQEILSSSDSGVFSSLSNQVKMVTFSLTISQILIHPIAGVLSDKYGGSLLLKIGLFIDTLLCISFGHIVWLFPWWGFPVINFIFGSAQSFVLTSVYSLLAHWINKPELTFISTAINVTCFCWHSLFITIIGYVDVKSVSWSMEMVGFGGFTILILLFFTVFSAPWTHPYLKKGRKTNLEYNTTNAFPQRIPFKNIIKSQSVRSVWFGYVAHKWLLIQLIFGYHTSWLYIFGDSKWMVKVLPLFGFFGGLISGYIFQNIINKNKMPIIYVRIVANLAGILLASLLITFGAHRHNIYFSFILYCLGFGVLGVGFTGSSVNVHDITRHYSGTIIGIGNGLVNCITLFYDTTHPASYCIVKFLKKYFKKQK